MYPPVVLDRETPWGYSSCVTSRLLDPSAIGVLLLGQSLLPLLLLGEEL